MANLSAKAPVESEKIGAYLHDRTRLPASPRAGYAPVGRQYWGWLLGIVLAAGFIALAFEIRAGWENHREWVVATTAPFLALTGLTFGLLVSRGKVLALATSAFFLALTLVFTLSNAWVGAETDGNDNLRDTLAILAGVTLGITVLSALIAVIAVEWRNPPKVPAPAE